MPKPQTVNSIPSRRSINPADYDVEAQINPNKSRRVNLIQNMGAYLKPRVDEMNSGMITREMFITGDLMPVTHANQYGIDHTVKRRVRATPQEQVPEQVISSRKGRKKKNRKPQEEELLRPQESSQTQPEEEIREGAEGQGDEQGADTLQGFLNPEMIQKSFAQGGMKFFLSQDEALKEVSRTKVRDPNDPRVKLARKPMFRAQVQSVKDGGAFKIQSLDKAYLGKFSQDINMLRKNVKMQDVQQLWTGANFMASQIEDVMNMPVTVDQNTKSQKIMSMIVGIIFFIQMAYQIISPWLDKSSSNSTGS